MPIYDFFCNNCKKNVEKLLKISESKNVKCDKCGTIMEKLPPQQMTFQLIYNPKKHISSWGNEGYSTTQRNRNLDGK